MTMKTAAKAGVALAALAATLGGHVSGDVATVGRRARLEFRVVGTASGSETRPLGSHMSGALEEGASTATNMKVKLFPAPEGWRPGPTAPAWPCKSIIGIQMGPADVPEAPLPLWQVEGVVHRAEMDRIQVGYTWKRLQASDGRSPASVADRGEVTLSEGAHVLLDFVAMPPEEETALCYRNISLELAASIPEDPAFQDRRIAYDLRLSSENHGQHVTRRLQLIGKQGENVGFDYGMFRSKLPYAPRPDKGSDVMEMTVGGGIRSRIQPDGSIEIKVVAYRTARPSDGHWATGASGQKQVRAAPGETLRLELPPPAPFSGVHEPDTFKALADQHVALILTPTLVD